jgi:cytochrome c-type biogenesis protein CcsB
MNQSAPSLRSTLKKISHHLFGTKAAGLYLLVFAVAIGVATFIENDFGTSSAQKVVFRTKWFEILLVLFSITLLANISRFRMIQNKKWALIMFHVAMIVIFIGAGITRYFGYEGMMHIREGEASDSFLSAETFLQFEAIKGQNTYRFDEPVLFATLGNNHWEKSYIIGGDKVEVEVIRFIPNPIEMLQDDASGLPTLKVVFGGAGGREEYYIKQGDRRLINNVVFNFGEPLAKSDIQLEYKDNNLSIQSDRILYQTVMATQEKDTLYPEQGQHMLRLRSLYSDGQSSFVFGDFNPQAKVFITSDNPKVKSESLTALLMKITSNGETQEQMVYGQKGRPGRATTYSFDDIKINARYGAKPIQVPFQIKLHEFIMERYPGTNSAMSYASEVSLIDQSKNTEFDYRIFMNNILDYGGYRFFQSSFDKDEKGTYLSVNYDFWGTWISYLGYILLTIGLVLTFFSKNSRFTAVRKKLQQMRSQAALFLLIVLTSFSSVTTYGQQNIQPQLNSVSLAHANLFSTSIVQDQKGRMKPIHTLSREIMRKVARTEHLFGLTADQVMLSMFADKKGWIAAPIIKIGKHEKINQLLELNTDYASYKDFFHKDGSYKLQAEVRRAYGLQPIDRGTFEKELMKLDERVNIVSMMFIGALLKMVPVSDDPAKTWVAAPSGQHGREIPSDPVSEKFFSAYQTSLFSAMQDGDYELADQLIQELSTFQLNKGGEIVPSSTQINFEMFLNKLNVFNRLALYYALLGIAFLIILFISVFRPSHTINQLFKILLGLVIVGFLFHTVGLGIRWYVSGRAPWSNGYESMIYIAWTSTLAGIIFTRKSAGGLAATMILAGSILLVAMLSYLDPEITPLVPVLRSYWLTIHVSLIAGSYGFLMLGAIIGLINLILIILSNSSNVAKIKKQITELTYISEITLIGGLVMIAVGTYLGGVWANESWGRYWGWDAKETWALVTILVYAFILHMRLIPGLRGLYAFNLATMFGMASVIMTYFGVNYYLSGLHSYAAGDPIPVPSWVYISVICVSIIGVLAYLKRKAFAR